jgi:hypothetical protein
MVIVLLEHFCHPDNWSVVQQLHMQNNSLVALTASGTPRDELDPAAAAAAASATSAVRLLKLTADGLFDRSVYTWGTQMKAGGFGTIHSATVRLLSGMAEE